MNPSTNKITSSDKFYTTLLPIVFPKGTDKLIKTIQFNTNIDDIYKVAIKEYAVAIEPSLMGHYPVKLTLESEPSIFTGTQLTYDQSGSTIPIVLHNRNINVATGSVMFDAIYNNYEVARFNQPRSMPGQITFTLTSTPTTNVSSATTIEYVGNSFNPNRVTFSEESIIVLELTRVIKPFYPNLNDPRMRIVNVPYVR